MPLLACPASRALFWCLWDLIRGPDLDSCLFRRNYEETDIIFGNCYSSIILVPLHSDSILEDVEYGPSELDRNSAIILVPNTASLSGWKVNYPMPFLCSSKITCNINK